MTPQEIQEYTDYLRQTGASEADINEFLKSQSSPAPEIQEKDYYSTGPVPLSELTNKKAPTMKETRDPILKALSYLGNVTRGAGAGAIQEATGNDLGVNLLDVLKGNAPSGEELLKRGDVLSDYPMTRTAAGLGVDIATDPSLLLSGGGALLSKYPTISKTLSKAGKAIDAGEVMGLTDKMNKAGKTLYQSGLKNLDTRAIEKGGEAVSPYMFEQGMYGTLPSIENQMQARMDALAKVREGLYNTASEKGAKVNPSAASEEALKYLSELDANPYMKPKVEGMLDYLSLAKEPLNVSDASKIKTQLYESLPASAFDEFGNMTSAGKELNKNLSQGYRSEIINQANAVEPGLGDAIDKVNQEWGAYLGAQKPLRSEITKEARKNNITQVDAMAVALSPIAAALKQGAKVINATPVRTGVGLAVQDAPAALWKNILLQPTIRFTSEKEK